MSDRFDLRHRTIAVTGSSAPFLLMVISRAAPVGLRLAPDPLEPGLMISWFPVTSDEIARHCLAYVDEAGCPHLFLFYGWEEALAHVELLTFLDVETLAALSRSVLDSALPSEPTEPSLHLQGLEAEVVIAAIQSILPTEEAAWSIEDATEMPN